MKKKLLLLCIVLAAALCGLAACSSAPDYTGMTKVTYMLEGGTYQTTDRPVVQYYDFKEGTENLIVDPETVTKKEIERSGYTLEGWYRTRTEVGDEVRYSDRWDFDNDKVTTEGITLYANWQKKIQHNYNICYRDKDGELKVLGTYTNMTDKTFDDYMSYTKTRSGYTFTGKFFDEDGNPWDATYKHPGGETDLTVNVVAEYIEGEYALVSTASELRSAMSKNIYLTADIDFNGGAFAGFVNYKGKVFEGNGYTVKNFTLDYGDKRDDLIEDSDLFDGDKVLVISLFGVSESATVRNVTFEGVKIDIKTTNKDIDKILVAPLFGKTSKATVSHVNVTGTVTVTRIPSKLQAAEDVVIVTDKAYYVADDSTSVTQSGFALQKAE